jgi:hypothetical protein
MNVLKTVSWVLLAVLAAAVLALSLFSAGLAYRGDPGQDVFGAGGPSVKTIEDWRPDIATAVRGRRGTASAYSAGFAVLMLAIVLGPYRRGEVWAWWALLAGAATVALVMFLRLPLLGTRLGAGGGTALLGVTALGLLLDAGRLRGPRGTGGVETGGGPVSAGV